MENNDPISVIDENGIKFVLDTENNTASVESWQNKLSGEIEIPASVTHDGVTYRVAAIQYGAFAVRVTNNGLLSHSLTSVTIPGSVTSIGSLAFKGCYNLKDITIPECVISIGSKAFNECSCLTCITLPKGVTIGEAAFSGCYNLTDITLSEGVDIGADAFSGCRNLTNITIPEDATIGDKAFSGCSGLTSLTLPAKRPIPIGVGAFKDCNDLTSIICLSAKPFGIRDGVFDDTTFQNATLYVPKGATAAYKKAFAWKVFQNIEQIEVENTVAPPVTNDTPHEDSPIANASYTHSECNAMVFDLAGHYIQDGNIDQLPKGAYMLVIGDKSK